MLTGFGSREWLTAIIRDASHARFYGDRNDRMPAIGPEEILSDCPDRASGGLAAGGRGGGWGGEGRELARSYSVLGVPRHTATHSHPLPHPSPRPDNDNTAR